MKKSVVKVCVVLLAMAFLAVGCAGTQIVATPQIPPECKGDQLEGFVSSGGPDIVTAAVVAGLIAVGIAEPAVAPAVKAGVRGAALVAYRAVQNGDMVASTSSLLDAINQIAKVKELEAFQPAIILLTGLGKVEVTPCSKTVIGKLAKDIGIAAGADPGDFL